MTECRCFGHAWDDVTGLAGVGPKVRYLHGRRVVLRCTRCGAERSEVWSTATGELVQRAYTYPLGYAAASGLGRADFRLQLLRPVPRKRRAAS